jgi:hypothetical protein
MIEFSRRAARLTALRCAMHSPSVACPLLLHRRQSQHEHHHAKDGDPNDISGLCLAPFHEGGQLDEEEQCEDREGDDRRNAAPPPDQDADRSGN